MKMKSVLSIILVICLLASVVFCAPARATAAEADLESTQGSVEQLPDGGENGTTPDGGENNTTPDGGENGTTPDGGENGTTPDGGENGTTPDGGENGTTPDGGENNTNPDGGDETNTAPEGEGEKNWFEKLLDMLFGWGETGTPWQVRGFLQGFDNLCESSIDFGLKAKTFAGNTYELIRFLIDVFTK